MIVVCETESEVKEIMDNVFVGESIQCEEGRHVTVSLSAVVLEDIGAEFKKVNFEDASCSVIVSSTGLNMFHAIAAFAAQLGYSWACVRGAVAALFPGFAGSDVIVGELKTLMPAIPDERQPLIADAVDADRAGEISGQERGKVNEEGLIRPKGRKLTFAGVSDLEQAREDVARKAAVGFGTADDEYGLYVRAVGGQLPGFTPRAGQVAMSREEFSTLRAHQVCVIYSC